MEESCNSVVQESSGGNTIYMVIYTGSNLKIGITKLVHDGEPRKAVNSPLPARWTVGCCTKQSYVLYNHLFKSKGHKEN